VVARDVKLGGNYETFTVEKGFKLEFVEQKSV